MDQITINDVLQKSFIAMTMGSIDRITTLNIVINILMSFLIGVFIFYIYKKTFQGVLYQRSFNVSLIIASTVTSLVIMTISGNLVLSLGMVGALSIVRFRTPVKDSMDLVFLFWAISAGIANGVGYYNISVTGSAMIAIFLLILTRFKSESNSYLIVMQLPADSDEEGIMKGLRKITEKVSLKSKTITQESVDLTLEAKIKGGATVAVTDALKEAGVIQATIVSYNDDFASA